MGQRPRAWVEDEREREREIREQRKRDERERRERLDNFGEDVSITGQSITSSKGDVEQAVESIDVGEIIRQHAAEKWNTASRGQKTMFNPCWRRSDSGTSCYVHNGNNTFYDTGEEASGGPARAMALGKGIIGRPGRRLSGERWGMVLDALRDDGYNIPVWIPEHGSDRSDGGTYDQTPLWALRKAAVALNVLPEDAFITRESGGGTYQGFGRQTYDQTLDELEALDIDHGRDRDGDSANTMPSRVEAGLEKEPEDRDEQVVQLFKEMGRQQQQSE